MIIRLSTYNNVKKGVCRQRREMELAEGNGTE